MSLACSRAISVLLLARIAADSKRASSRVIAKGAYGLMFPEKGV